MCWRAGCSGRVRGAEAAVSRRLLSTTNVIPGRRAAANPESVGCCDAGYSTARDSGFARWRERPGMASAELQASYPAVPSARRPGARPSSYVPAPFRIELPASPLTPTLSPRRAGRGSSLCSGGRFKLAPTPSFRGARSANPESRSCCKRRVLHSSGFRVRSLARAPRNDGRGTKRRLPLQRLEYLVGALDHHGVAGAFQDDGA